MPRRTAFAVPLACACCGFDHPPEARSRGGCGRCVAATIATHAAEGGERRQLIVLLCDLADSLGRAHDPEALQQLPGSLGRLGSDGVHRCDGVLIQFLGHGILACFGYPLAHADNPERSALALLAVAG